MFAEAVAPAVWGFFGVVVGALLGLLPKLFDVFSGDKSGQQEQVARMKMMLANVLMNCVHATNEFLNQVAKLHLDSSLRGEGEGTGADLQRSIDLAFAMKTAWMDALISFGDRGSDKEPVDPRRAVIQKMLKDLDATYDQYRETEATPELIVAQLQQIERLSRIQLERLIGLTSGP